jgi:hypothetical protein
MTAEKTRQGKRNRTHGRDAEKAVATYLRACGLFPWAEPRGRGGPDDFGDMTNTTPALVEVKAEKAHRLGAYIRQLRAAMEHFQAKTGVVFIKPPGVGMTRVGEWYAVLPVELVCQLLAEAGYGSGMFDAVHATEETPT